MCPESIRESIFQMVFVYVFVIGEGEDQLEGGWADFMQNQKLHLPLLNVLFSHFI